MKISKKEDTKTKNVTNEEWLTVKAQSPSNDDLRYLIRYTTKADEATKILNDRSNAPQRMIDVVKNR